MDRECSPVSRVHHFFGALVLDGLRRGSFSIPVNGLHHVDICYDRYELGRTQNSRPHPSQLVLGDVNLGGRQYVDYLLPWAAGWKAWLERRRAGGAPSESVLIFRMAARLWAFEGVDGLIFLCIIFGSVGPVILDQLPV